jgi:hypothetical protein
MLDNLVQMKVENLYEVIDIFFRFGGSRQVYAKTSASAIKGQAQSSDLISASAWAHRVLGFFRPFLP